MTPSSRSAGRAAALALLFLAAAMMAPVDAWGPFGSSVPVGSSFVQTHKAVSHAPFRTAATAPATSHRATPNGGVQVAIMQARNPDAIGVRIPAGFNEGADYIRDGRNLNPGDLVLISRSDGSVRIGEISKKAGMAFQSQFEVIVEPSGASRVEEALNLGKPTPAGLAKLGIGNAPVVNVVKGTGNAPPPPKAAAPAQKAPPASAPPAQTPAPPASSSPAEDRKRQQEEARAARQAEQEAKKAEQKRIQEERQAAQKAAQEERQRQLEEKKRQQEEARAEQQRLFEEKKRKAEEERAAKAAAQAAARNQPPPPASQPPPPKAAAPKAAPARQGSGGFFGLGSAKPAPQAAQPPPPKTAPPPAKAAPQAPTPAASKAVESLSLSFPGVIGNEIEPGWVEGKDFKKSDGNLAQGDLVILKRSDGSLRFGEVVESTGLPWQQAFMVCVVATPDGKVESTRAETASNLFVLNVGGASVAAPA
eukprot:CAMPEP_0169430640 /NCGR_PEP_ID=MMETSP1042-20121227/2509_1 /TAXON_ID=464988 /ORGANISM="Hemiselmis andersenii, Strain CCMP1180" /LENGTH=477 /DNA_ID=CAMNT_0009540973 /DNA_START=155 /DNA_END=1585 /DNA_ORIENTATION=-